MTITDCEPPTINCPADRQLTCGASTNCTNTGTATATDNCGGTPTITFTDAATPPGCAGRPGIDRTWRACDSHNNCAICVQHITFVDSTPPVICCPGNRTLQCGDPSDPAHTGTATATDSCGSAVTITYDDDVGADTGCTGLAGIDRTWTAVDACSNVSTCVQHIVFVDTTPPVITCPPDVTLQCGDSTDPAQTGTATATDNCGDPDISYTDAPAPAGCSGVPGINRTWRAVDDCNNVSTCVQHLTYVDTTPPVITCPGNITVCNDVGHSYATVSFTIPSATDNCGGPVTVTACPASGSHFNVGCNTVVVTAHDACGNTTSCSFLITVNNCTAPRICCPPCITVPHASGSCCAPVTFTPTASGGSGQLTIVSTPPSGYCFPVGTTTVSSYARDSYGRQSQPCTFTVTVLGSICGTVWFDRDADGSRDSCDTGLGGVKVQLKTTGYCPQVIATRYTNSDGSYCFDVPVGCYQVVVVAPCNFTISTSSSCTKTITASNCAQTCDFGISCSSQLTHGCSKSYWGNCSGKTTCQSHDQGWRTCVNTPCLRNCNGSRFSVGTSGCSFNNANSCFQNWINCTNTSGNMACQLSQELAACKLAIQYKGLDPNCVVVLTSAQASSYGCSSAPICTIISQCESALSQDGYTPSGDSHRPWQDCLRSILNGINTNCLRKANPQPCDFNTPY